MNGSTDSPPQPDESPFQRAVRGAVDDLVADYKRQMDRQLFWGRWHPSPFPTFVLFPRIERLHQWWKRRVYWPVRNFKARIPDAWNVLRGRYYE